jgi:4-methyl-5(b-hydroxyethyl)-thiazole monophosphate biosynthesis
MGEIEAGSVVLVLPATGFPGASVRLVIDRLLEAGVPVVVASPSGGLHHGADDVRITPDAQVDDPRLSEMVGVAVFDGDDGGLAEDFATVTLLRTMHDRGKLVAAFGAGVRTLARAGLVRNREVSALPQDADVVAEAGGEVVLTPMVSSRGILTARGASAEAFGDAILEFRGIEPMHPPAA